MLYLKARETGFDPLDSWKGRHGNFAKTFLISDQRNKNGWRVTWNLRDICKRLSGQARNRVHQACQRLVR